MSEKPTIIVDPHPRTMDEIFSPDDRQRLPGLGDIIWGKDDPMPRDEFLKHLPQADVVISFDWDDRYGDVLSQAEKLRAVITVSGVLPLEMNYDYCFKNNIRVLSAAPTFTRQVAEWCLGMAICSCRELALGDRAFRAGEEAWLHAGNIGNYLLYGKPVGFIGFGSVARELTKLLAPFGVPMSAYDPWLADGFIRTWGVQPVDLETVLKESRFIFVLAAPTAENRAFLGRDELELIDDDAVFILVSRAHVVDFDALTDLLLANRFRAAIDVFPAEPLDANHPIRGAENAILSAHRAGSVEEGLWEIGEMALDDLEAILKGFPPQRMHSAQPELVKRYAAITVPADED